jgi:Flp pilus assembly protein TadD
MSAEGPGRPQAPGIAARVLDPRVLPVLLGVGLRLARLLEARATDPLYDRPLLDSAWYDELARSFLSGGLVQPEAFTQAPLYGASLALVYGALGLLGVEGTATPVFVLQVLLSGLMIGLGARLGQAVAGRAGAWTAGLALALDPVLILYDSVLLGTSLNVLLGTASALALHRVWNERRAAWPHLGLGLLLGLATTGRANLLLGLPLLVGLFGVDALRGQRARLAPLLLALGMSLPVGLCLAHNLAADGTPALVTTGGGVNLYRGNNALFSTAAVQDFRLPAEPAALAKKAALVASIEAQRPLSPAEVDRYWTGRALAAWRAEPLRLVGLTLRKVSQVLSSASASDNFDADGLRARSRVLRWLPSLWGPVVALGLVGLWREGRRREAAPLLLLLVTGVGSVALFFALDRYRLPLFAVFGAFAGAALWPSPAGGDEETARTRTPRARAIRGLAALGLGAFFALPPTSRLQPWNLLVPARPSERCAIDQHVFRAPEVEAEYGSAVWELLHGDRNTAEAGFRAAFTADPGHTAAGVNLSYLLLQRGDPTGAAAVASRVVEVDPCDDKAWANLAAARLRTGSARGAVEAAERAVSIDRYDPGARLLLAQSSFAAGDRLSARREAAWLSRWDPTEPAGHALLARLELLLGNYTVAVQVLEAALPRCPGEAELHGMLAVARFGAGDRAGAAQALEAALRLPGGPTNEWVKAAGSALQGPPPSP